MDLGRGGSQAAAHIIGHVRVEKFVELAGDRPGSGGDAVTCNFSDAEQIAIG